MAYATTQEFAPKKSIWVSLINTISGYFADIMEANSRSLEVQRLQSMSDRDLADIGLARQDIVRRVFADKAGL